MLTTLELENFKAFGERARISFAPITLVFGENSAGKSSILHALNLLKQTRESPGSGALLLPRAEHGTVDLGSFQELLFDHDLSRTLRIRLGATWPQSSPMHGLRSTGLPEALAVEMSLSRPSRRREIQLDKWEVFSESSPNPLAVFVPTTASADFADMWSPERRGRAVGSGGATYMRCESISMEPKLWKPAYESARLLREEIVAALQHTDAAADSAPSTLFDGEPISQRRRDQDAFLRRAREFFLADFSIDSYIEFMSEQQRGLILAFDGLVPESTLPPSRLRRLRHLLLPRNAARRLVEFDVAHLAVMAGRLLDETLDALFPLGPFRRPPARWYIFTGTSPADVGYRGDLLPDLLLRHPELVKEANRWLERLAVGYKLKPKQIGAQSDLFELRLADNRRSQPVEVGLADVGFGISQILPFVVQSLAGEDQIISIEQPEVHLHPRLQADLGDLIAEAIQPPRGNQFIIETHSEHLILRLQRLVRSGKVSAGDLSILHVSRASKGAQVTRLLLDERGDFADDWPGGFFPERLREIQ